MLGGLDADRGAEGAQVAQDAAFGEVAGPGLEPAGFQRERTAPR